MALLAPTDYPAIRAAIDVSLDSMLLPDTVIVLDMYAGAGVRDVLKLDPNAASRTGNALAHATTAAILFVAARIVGALPQIVKETFPDHSYERSRIDSGARAAELRTLAAAEIDAYLDPGDVTSDRPTRFAVAGGRRGRW